MCRGNTSLELKYRHCNNLVVRYFIVFMAALEEVFAH